MKRIIICIILLLFAINISAQHLNFMGIPMGSHINTFSKSLESKGFKLATGTGMNYPNFYYYSGVFAGERVGLTVIVTPSTKKVSDVGVIFADYIHYKSGLNSSYGVGVSLDKINILFNDLSRDLTKKYGVPIESEKDDPMIKKSHWFRTNEGDIHLHIEYIEEKNIVRVSLSYTDKSTDKLNSQERLNDL